MQRADRTRNNLTIPLAVTSGLLLGLFVLRAGTIVSLGLFTVLGLGLLVYFYPVYGILGVMGCTCFIPYGSVLPFTNVGSIHVPDLILFVLVLIAILRTVLQPDVRLVRTPLDAPIIIFVAVGAASLVAGKILYSYDFFTAVHRFKVMLYYLLALLIPNLVRTRKDLRILIYGSLILGIASALQVIVRALVNPPTAMDNAMEVFYRYQDVTKSGLLMFWTLVSLVCLFLAGKVKLSYW
ncbi:MAG: hypothetical protein JRJ26_20670, partial [Deltaproteobacteria bacterium]|nr:hypothetical protein [Deltaproteobacteria bacterium]